VAAVTVTLERGAKQEGQKFDPRRISPSRVNALVSCGVAFDMKYLQGLPEEVSGSAALFGSVIHLALERWTLNDVNTETGEVIPGRTKPLIGLMRQAWLDYADDKAPVIRKFLDEYVAISADIIRAEHAAAVSFEKRMKKPCKAPRMTKEFKESAAAKKLNHLYGKWRDRLNRESPFRFREEYDPLPKLYDESLVVAKRYESRWSHLPPAYSAELGFEEPWRGFTLNGYIDSIEPVIDRDTGEQLGIGIWDYKTYAKPPAAHKDWRQVVMYDVAYRSLIERNVVPPIPDGQRLFVGIDYVRWTDSWVDDEGNPVKPRRLLEVGPADYDRLERELTAYLNTVEGRNFLPAEKGRNPDFCPYPSACCLRNCVAAGGETKTVEVNL
jgi:hypothetical protein